MKTETTRRHFLELIAASAALGLDSRLLACVADANVAPSARVMAVQLCGERRIASSWSDLRRIAESSDEPQVLRLAATRSLKLLDGREIAQ